MRETEPAGNSEKSRTSRACFAFDDFELLEETTFVADFDAAFAFVTPEAFAFEAFGATAFLLAVFFAADFFEAFDADFFGAFDAASFFAAFLTARADFFAAVFELFLVEGI